MGRGGIEGIDVAGSHKDTLIIEVKKNAFAWTFNANAAEMIRMPPTLRFEFIYTQQDPNLGPANSWPLCSVFSAHQMTIRGTPHWVARMENVAAKKVQKIT
uniref:Uncharacterized protein n=1 Tax=Eutreptiella gymnastica TaxID=73025 RepID=A0A6U8K0R0_9EUGL|mmetsp:Transcript_68504/g.121195  ORF Transcript_68504/g.121195 Transcript_68504/m.121195 type:complete len:101 (+) Transcript_68504:1508-1810(+)